MQAIQVNQLKQLLSEDNAADAIILDVRTRSEHAGERIVGATNIPLDEIEHHIDDLRHYKHIYIHCNSGNRSVQACQKLDSLGLNNLVNVEGGIQAWKQAGFPIFKNTKAPLPIMQQVQVAAGSFVVGGVALSQLVDPLFLAISGFVGAGLVFSGMTGTCTLGVILSRMPWNRR